MRFRLGLFLGLAIGYVLGAKAGRERYAQIQDLARKAKRSEPAQQISEEVRSTASQVGEQVESKASEKVAQINQAVRSSTGADDPKSQVQS